MYICKTPLFDWCPALGTSHAGLLCPVFLTTAHVNFLCMSLFICCLHVCKTPFCDWCSARGTSHATLHLPVHISSYLCIDCLAVCTTPLCDWCPARGTGQKALRCPSFYLSYYLSFFFCFLSIERTSAKLHSMTGAPRRAPVTDNLIYRSHT